MVELARRLKMWVISDLAYADLAFDDRPAPSIFLVKGAREVAIEFFTVSKSYSMPGWRVGFAVGNPDLVGGLATVKGYLDYGVVRPHPAGGRDRAGPGLRPGRGGQPRPLPAPGGGADPAPWPRRAGRSTPPRATMFLWAPIPERFRAMGAVDFAAELLEKAGVAVAPGVGFGAGGEGFVRFSLIEPDDRVRRAAEQIGKLLKS